MNSCKLCSTLTTNPSFCSKSCSQSYNNKGSRRHGHEPNRCPVCDKQTRTNQQKYCSRACSSSVRIKTKEEVASANAARQSNYRAKKLRQFAPDADVKKIREIYKNRPAGYEVDHIKPLSKGGLHHEDNLQYLPTLVNRKKGNRF